jgi:hypothetical protein
MISKNKTDLQRMELLLRKEKITEPGETQGKKKE